MFDPFTFLPVRNKDVAAGSLQTLIQVHEREMFTGVLHLQNAAGEQAALFCVQGGILLFHLAKDGNWTLVPANEWRARLSGLAGDLRILPLPVEGLRTLRLFLDLDPGEVTRFEALPTTVVLEKINEWQKSPQPSLIHLSRNDMTVFAAFPGGISFSSDALLLSPERIQTGLGVLGQIRSWGERPSNLTHVATDLSSPAGQEYCLRISFLKLAQKVLERYQELAGRFLGSALNEEINHMSRERGWSMYFAGTGVTHREFFRDVQRAGEAYQAVLYKLENEMELVVGSQIAGQIIRDALAELAPAGRELLLQHAFSRTRLMLDQFAEAV